MKCNLISVSVVSFSYQEAESVEVILSVDQSAVASLWDVPTSNVTVSIALLRLQMCKLASAFVLNLKSVFLCAETVSVLLAMKDCYNVSIKGKYKV